MQVSSSNQTAYLAGHPFPRELLAYQRSALLAYVRRRVRTEEDAEDIVQITLARAAANMHAFKGQCTFSGWLYRIAANQIITYYQRVLPKTDRQVSLDTGFDGEEPNLQPSAPERSPEELAATAD